MTPTDELLERAIRTAPPNGKVEPTTIPGAAGAVRLELGTAVRRVTAASAWDDRAMAATWANMAAMQLGAAA